MLSSDFHCKENDVFRVVSIHPGLFTSDYGVHKVGVTVCGVQHWSLTNIKFAAYSFYAYIDLGGLGVTCSLRDPRFAG